MANQEKCTNSFERTLVGATSNVQLESRALTEVCSLIIFYFPHNHSRLTAPPPSRGSAPPHVLLHMSPIPMREGFFSKKYL